MNSSKSVRVNVDQLRFDPENPRLPSTLNKEDETAVLEYMLEYANILDLMGSIAQQGYFPGEALLTIPNPKKNEEYFVVEGNRRLAALKLLMHPDLAPISKNKVKEMSETISINRSQIEAVETIVYTQREQILDYLGYRHITGVMPWSSLAKARYLKQLVARYAYLEPNERNRLIARVIGSRPDYVAKLSISDRKSTRLNSSH